MFRARKLITDDYDDFDDYKMYDSLNNATCDSCDINICDISGDDEFFDYDEENKDKVNSKNVILNIINKIASFFMYKCS